MTASNRPKREGQPNHPALPSSPPRPHRLLSRKEVEATYGISARWLELAAWQGIGPPLVKISRRMVRYLPQDIEAWIEARRLSAKNDTLGGSK